MPPRPSSQTNSYPGTAAPAVTSGTEAGLDAWVGARVTVSGGPPGGAAGGMERIGSSAGSGTVDPRSGERVCPHFRTPGSRPQAGGGPQTRSVSGPAAAERPDGVDLHDPAFLEHPVEHLG